jgi:hypothetical protein
MKAEIGASHMTKTHFYQNVEQNAQNAAPKWIKFDLGSARRGAIQTPDVAGVASSLAGA